MNWHSTPITHFLYVSKFFVRILAGVNYDSCIIARIIMVFQLDLRLLEPSSRGASILGQWEISRI